MKMNLQGIDIELTPEEFVKMQELTHGEKEPKDMTLQEEMEFIQKLRHFKIIDMYVDGNSNFYIQLVSDNL